MTRLTAFAAAIVIYAIVAMPLVTTAARIVG